MVSELDIDLGVLDATELDSRDVRASGYRLLNDVTRNLQEEGGCISECNDKADVTDCAGISRVSWTVVGSKGID